MKVVKLKVSEVSLDPANARKHSEESVQSIAASLRRFGQQTPIVVGEDFVVIKGNGTLLAAKHLKKEFIFATVTDLEGADRTGYAIADNRTAELSTWEWNTLSEFEKSLPEEVKLDVFDEGLSEMIGFYADDFEKSFPAHSSEDLDEKIEQKVFAVKVMVEDFETSRLVAAAVQELVNANPDWKAEVK